MDFLHLASFLLYSYGMKKLVCLIYVLISGALVFCNTDKINVASVKIIIDDVLYVWQEDNAEPVLFSDSLIFRDEYDDIDVKLKVSTILSYSNLKPGKSFSIADFESECLKTEYRLLNCGLLYSAKVSIISSRKKVDSRTVIIDVKSGFFNRFGGGNAYFVFGKNALNGNRDSLLFCTGYNKNGVSYINENVCGVPIILGGELFLNAPMSFSHKYDAVLSLGETVAYRPYADFVLGIRAREKINFNNANNNKYLIQPFISYNKYLNTKFYSESEIEATIINNTLPSMNGAFVFRFNPVKRITIASLFSAGFSFFSNSFFSGDYANNKNFNLYEVLDSTSKNSGLSNLVIRSGYSENDLLTNEYYMASFEVRLNAFSHNFASVFTCSVVPFVYCESAFIKINNSYELRDAFGSGIRLLFDNPVFAYFSFSYGFNHKFQPRFYFSASAGF